MVERRIYSRTQLEYYYDRIQLPSSSRLFTVIGLPPDAQFQFLLLLQKYQLMKIPFENLTLHYSWHRVIDLGLDHLFDKIVCNSGRGGYCMENNTFFHAILLSLGYNAYMVGGRVYNKDLSRYGGLTHCLTIVTIGGEHYAVDVGFGSKVPILPLKLSPGEPQRHSEPGQMRVRYDRIPQNLSLDQKIWIYEHRNDDESEWVPQYCFVDLEFLPEDLRAMNWAPSKSSSSFFTQKVVCVRFTAETEDFSKIKTGDKHLCNGELSQAANCGVIDGALIIDGDSFKWRKKGVKQWDMKFESDGERLEALERYFYIKLTEEDKQAIRGCVGEIRGRPSGSKAIGNNWVLE